MLFCRPGVRVWARGRVKVRVCARWCVWLQKSQKRVGQHVEIDVLLSRADSTHREWVLRVLHKLRRARSWGVAGCGLRIVRVVRCACLRNHHFGVETVDCDRHNFKFLARLIACSVLQLMSLFYLNLLTIRKCFRIFFFPFQLLFIIHLAIIVNWLF